MVVENRMRLANVYKEVRQLANLEAFKELRKRFTREKNGEKLAKLKEIEEQEQNMLDKGKPRGKVSKNNNKTE